MSPSNQPLQPYYNEFLRCTICSHDFEHDNSLYRPITLPICGHTMCGQCIDIIRNQNKCPQDQVSFGCNSVPLDQLPTNYPLLILLFDSLQVEAMGKVVVGNQLPFSHLVARRRWTTIRSLFFVHETWWWIEIVFSTYAKHSGWNLPSDQTYRWALLCRDEMKTCDVHSLLSERQRLSIDSQSADDTQNLQFIE